MGDWRVWHSANSFGKYIVDHTILAQFKSEIEYKLLPESDASKGGEFHRVPDHIKKILYLDAADLIVEYRSNPVLCIEETKEAGTGHNALQRFARIAAAAENGVPVIYIMPEAKIIERKEGIRWDAINPIVFQTFNSVMDTFRIPALFFYFPSDYRAYPDPSESPRLESKGIVYSSNIIDYPACPDENDDEMKSLFDVLNIFFNNALTNGMSSMLVNNLTIRKRQYWMQRQFYTKIGNRNEEQLSPITATKTISTDKLFAYLAKFSSEKGRDISELLASRETTVVYQCDSTFRADPYAGTLAAIDYLTCRSGKTYEDRVSNLVLCFGKIVETEEGIDVVSSKCSVDDFIHTVHNSMNKNLLAAERFSDIKRGDIGRYYMQVRYGSTYSKVKHIRVFSYYADAILFADGALWREA